jgi:hypothetical protein
LPPLPRVRFKSKSTQVLNSTNQALDKELFRSQNVITRKKQTFLLAKSLGDSHRVQDRTR